MWGGLALSYAIASLPSSTAIIGMAASAYAGASIWSRLARRRPNDTLLSAGANE
jgi:hypothetical protein